MRRQERGGRFGLVIGALITMASATTFRPRRMLVTPSEFAIESFEHPGQALTIARSVDLGSDVTVAVKPGTANHTPPRKMVASILSH